MYRSTFHNKRRTRLTFWLVMLSLILIVVSVAGVTQAAGTVTGLVFRDYNANGVQDANEPGVGGVTITAYGAAGTVVGSATSSAALATLGTYSISWASADTRVRLEFTGLPGVAQQGAASSAAGGSGTSVQFVNAGAVANYGINRPSDYCLVTPALKLATTCFELGAQTSGTARVVVSHNYDGTGGDNPVAVDTQVGTTWGVAYRRAPVGSPTASGTIYVSAFAKRQADYGPNGSGAIYAINAVTSATVLLTTIPNAGATLHNPANFAIDSTFYAAPGKQGLGDMDISEDGTTLYVVNLNDRQLYSVNIATGVPTARGIIGPPNGTCVNGVYRPFGLGIRDGIVYVGGVCTGETAAPGTTTGLQAYVYSFNPATNASAQVLTFPLNYPRGCADIDPSYGNPGAPMQCRTVPLATNGSRADWQPWRDAWPAPDQPIPGTGFSPGAQEFFAYPQPILAGIEFVGEDMVVSFRDRMGDQIGYLDNGPDGLGGVFPDNLITVTAGDILRASPNGLGGWTIENNARSNPPGVFGPSTGANNEQGPGNGEFYWQDNFQDGNGIHHDETITGGIVQVPGAPEISAEIMDPNGLFSAGTGWFDNGTGARNRDFTIIGSTTAPNFFGKGNGLGDLAALCDSAPIEIGNYVWFDANQNGIQDANEQPLAGVIVQLVNPITSAVIATATTDAQGRYLFSSNATASSGSFIYNVPFTENTNYQVRIDTTQAILNGFSTTTPNVGAGVNAVRDSNGVPTGTLSIANVTTGTAGQNNHTIDFGFFTPPYSLGNRIWFDDGRGGGTANDGIQNGTEVGIDGVTVNLLDNNGNIIATTVTTAGGYYRFDNLPPGSYTVEIPASNFTAPGGVLAGMNSSADAPTSATPNNDVDRDDNGVLAVAGGVRSNPVQLGPPGPVEPSGETDLGPGGSGTATDDHSNLTVDFGFFLTPVTTYSLGNRVWADTNDSGTIDGGEAGIGGVVVNLYSVTGGVPSVTPIRTLTTDANGYYLFDNLPPGDYIVEIPGSNFNPGGALVGLRSSTPDETNPNSDVDSNDNGIGTASGTVRSGIVTLGPGGSEPIGEGDVGPQGTGIAADDHSNLTVDFGFVGTPSGGSGAGPIRLDPAIVKLVDPKFALPGEDVRWTIVVTNPHSVDVHNVTFVDNFPSQLEIISTSADNNVGSLTVNGNTVTYSIVVINPGQSVRVNVLTRIRKGTPIPFIITNTVNLTNGLVGSSSSIIASASATVVSAGSLPATGLTPVWREPLLAGVAMLLVLFGIGVVRVRQRGYRSS